MNFVNRSLACAKKVYSLAQEIRRARYSRLSYAQEGEDLVLERMFEHQAFGTYVDVGAHHPFRFSNTCRLYERGWRGINIDAMPGSMDPFRRHRPRDVNLECGVASMPQSLRFHVFKEPALNTFDSSLAAQRVASGWPRKEVLTVECMPLAAILDREMPSLGNRIDLLSVDVEGLDLAVLQSNNWEKYRPKAVIVENLDQDLAGVAASDVGRFLAGMGYSPFAKLHHSVIFSN